MSFTRVKPSGWGLNDPITPAQINQLDINVSRALDAYIGGSYNPGGVIEILGLNGISIDTLTFTPDNWPRFSAARTVRRAQGLRPVFISSISTNTGYGFVDNAAADWVRKVTPGKGSISQQYVNATPAQPRPDIWFELVDYPQMATLKSAEIDVYHPTAGSDAAEVPKAQVWFYTYALDGTPTLSQIGADTDIAASYRNKVKRISVDFGDFVPADGEQNRLFIALVGEGGAGAALGLAALQTYLTFSHTLIRY